MINRNYDIYSIEERVHNLEMGDHPHPVEDPGTIQPTRLIPIRNGPTGKKFIARL